jgi:hypothetical protein
MTGLLQKGIPLFQCYKFRFLISIYDSQSNGIKVPPLMEHTRNYLVVGVYSISTSRTVYDYTSGSSSEQAQEQKVYDLYADGDLDEGNYKQFLATPSAVGQPSHRENAVL